MTSKELQFCANLLDAASEVFSNHGCNDINPDSHTFTDAEKAQFAKDVYEWDDGVVGGGGPFESLQDWMVMSYFASELRAVAEVID